MEKKRSIGIIVLGAILLLCSIPALCVAFLAAISGGEPNIHIRLPLIAGPLIFLLSALGILMLKSWGRLITIILSSILSLLMITLAIVSLLYNLSENLSFAICLLVIGIFFISVIYYLTRPKVKEQFR